MENTINTYKYVTLLGDELIRDFEKSKNSIHPHECGTKKEISTIEKLQDILPEGIGVGSGFVIDSYGNISAQADIIIYEKNFALKFYKSNPNYTYYNCESVIAVGEIKSNATYNKVKDAINKLVKVKKLRRAFALPDKDGFIAFRKFLSSESVLGFKMESDEFEKHSKIYTFLLCEKLSVSDDFLLSCIKDESANLIHLFPDCVIATEGKYFSYCDMEKRMLSPIVKWQPDVKFVRIDKTNCFNLLVSNILYTINFDFTVPLNYLRYIQEPNNSFYPISKAYDL